MGRAAIADLIVVHHRAASGGQVFETVDVVMGAARAAVGNDQGQAP